MYIQEKQNIMKGISIEEQKQAILTAASYYYAIQDIKNGKNLDMWLETTESLIADIDKKIEDNKGNDSYIKTLDDIKNSLCYLKYEILERI